jgi:hypothetical protein
MRFILAMLVAATFAMPAIAQQIVSEYTDLDHDQHCSVVAGGDATEGDWSNLVCQGWRGYPVLIYYSDARESIFYGFPPSGDLAPTWESFMGFSRAGAKIEWRIEHDGAIPFATIHRWSVDADSDSQQVNVLVVQKVGQLHPRAGCVVGYVVATGNSEANEKARRMADGKARDHSCGNQPTIDAGAVPLPAFIRTEN